MESESNSRKGSSKMAFQIDLNETPISSPREAWDDTGMGSATTSLCTECRKGIPVGKITDKASGEQRPESKCFRCLLKSNAGSRNGSGSGIGAGGEGNSEVGRFDINASPPREDGDDVAVVSGRGSSKLQASTYSSIFNNRASTRQVNPMLEHIGHNLPKTFRVTPDSASAVSREMLQQKVHSDGNIGTVRPTFEVGRRASQSTPLEFPPESPNMLYLQTLREYIAERSGVLEEGWRVEFEFCERSYKTSAVYIAPDGSRLKSMEDVARHIGLPSWNHYVESGNGNNEVSFIRSGLRVDPVEKEPSAFSIAQNFRQKQKILRGSNSQGFFSGSGSGAGCSDVGFSVNGCRPDAINEGLPIQFQDFCLQSAGKVDSRPSYHSANQIWPVGYRSSWHDRVTGSLFLCDVEDGSDSGPNFKVRRYPCTMQSIPVGSTILSKAKPVSCKGDDKRKKDDSATFQVLDDESLSTITLLNQDSPPSLENCLSTSKREDEVHNARDNSSNSDLESLPQRTGNVVGDGVGLNDIIGEFEVQGRSTSSVWEMVSQAFLYACHETYKQKGVIKFFCGHDPYGLNNGNTDGIDSLSRFCHFDGGVSIPPLVQNENEFKMACEKLLAWLNQDRFGLDVDFVQEIIERLPGVAACPAYKSLNDRKSCLGLQTVGSGFLLAEQKTSGASGMSKRSQLKSGDSQDVLTRDPCPPGKLFNSSLPSYLMGDALQVWELAWRFLEILGLGQPFSFKELELELVSPWLDSYPLDSRYEAIDYGGVSRAGGARLGRCTGHLLAKIIGSMLKVLVRELLSKAAVYVPNFDAGESKSKRSRKKDLDSLAALKKTKLDMLPVNEFTWPEIARRYLLAVMSMEGNLDSSEIASRESGRVFHCLRGDGGILCGSLTGIAALEGDAVVLADAVKEIFGSLKSKNDIVSVFERDSDADGAQAIEVNDGVIPEWAQVLEPVRKLPTNVGARIRRCINEALEKDPPEWAKKALLHSISKEVYKGNASGPTKRAVISVLAKLGSENPQQKAEKKEKVKIKTSLGDLIAKQCRIVLRQAASLDEDRVFCNLMARIILNPNDNDDEGLLGYPAMVSRPLDFRTIDLRLAVGAYGGSHEAFVDDVREVWRNIRTAYGDRADLIEVAEKLSQTFEDLYEKEVLTLVQKIDEISNVNNDSSADAIKERDDLLVQVCNKSLPRAPWDEGICKVCGMDKDDDNVLLCDKCDSEYHRYCLNPPLLRIPEGNWYCPSCVAGKSISCTATQPRKRRSSQGELTRVFLEELARLANLMEIKEYWEFTVEERVFFMKFLFDEALNSATIRDHMDQCASRTTDLQQKLRSLTTELKLLKIREEIVGLNVEKASSGVFSGRGDLKSDASSYLLTVENSSRGKPSDKSTHFSPFLQPDDGQCSKNNKSFSSADMSSQSQSQQLARDHSQPAENVFAHPRPLSQENSLKMVAIKNEISNMQGSIASIELELLKVSLRKDFLGRDSNGRVYWAFHCPGSSPWIVACGDVASKERPPEEFAGIPDSDKWMYYESDDEIEKLVRWLRESNTRDKELRDSVLQLQSNKLKESEYTENHILTKEVLNHNGKEALQADFLPTKAMAAIEKKFGSTESTDFYQNLATRMYRCECLELLWPSKEHCALCHQSFPTAEELQRHAKENCKAAASSVVSEKNQTTEDISKRKKSRNVASQEKRLPNMGLPSEKLNGGSSSSKRNTGDCPFNFEEIMTRFVVPGSVKDVMNEVGIISNGGIPSFLPSESPYLSDPSLALHSTKIFEASASEVPANSRNQTEATKDSKESSRLSRFGEHGLVEEGSTAERVKSILTSERDQVSSLKDKNCLLGLSKSSIIRESSSRPLVGRAAETLRFLKMNLLDMDAALPEDAFRTSRSNRDRRCAWNAFVKSARSIYEMVQAIIILEDTIKSEYLQNDWWYWSSASTAAKTTTLSALALRIYSLDAAISYDRPLGNNATQASDQKRALDEEAPEKNLASPSSPPLQKTAEADAGAENPRTRSRTSKRRKE